MFAEPIVECVYGWGQVLRLYPDHVDIEGVSYELHDLLNFRPVYRRIMGVASMRLDLQFSTGAVILRGIADIPLALRVIAYLNTWSAVTIGIKVEELSSIPELPSPSSIGYTPRPLVLSDSSQESFWEYDANDQPTTVGPLDAVVDMTQTSGQSTDVTASQFAITLEAVPAWPWTDERHLQHKQRLQRLQAEREKRLYGFDRETLMQRLRDEPLPQLRVPARLLVDEIAHYCTSARLCTEPLTGGKRTKFKVKDQGTLILTNRRLIYLGRKRQIVLEYERVLQASHIPDAVLISADYWSRPQCFSMRRSLECAMYLEQILWRNSVQSASSSRMADQPSLPQKSLVEYHVSQ
ncbi:hypothetical protein KDA_26110 [Dictyobacter alpinus]|uniref:Uncharacterized protein n=1 Tax=Dictyobacter alpinus TaxID=2014873 RepID=A0A402B726_9CHLR|nr:hypothetical protein [Dictyobacter alpinus]GCE27127.1 hypothetical protein KDA_26110 [Dictyobacter alpinus]